MKKLLLYTLSFFLLCAVSKAERTLPAANNFLGMWTLDIEGGGVGWLEVHEQSGFLDANLLWIGGSVLPVGNVYLADENTLVVTRVYPLSRSGDRKQTMTFTMRLNRVGDHLVGNMIAPNRSGMGETVTAVVGTLLPEVPPTPDISTIEYGEPVELFNGKDLTGWELIDPTHSNGFKAVEGELVNDPVQPAEGEHLHYGNLRTKAEFEDFTLTLEVNVPEGNNSGIYLKGMYEIQVYDSYGKDLDSHNMGALYSRIVPSLAAEKPAGSWQSFDITLYKRHLTVVLNGRTIIDNQPIYGPTGGAILSDVFAPGPIFLQGDHGKVAYRNLVLRPIL
ncbi:MAG: DUF1080 domain-containing protein [Bacteroidota bacterium]